MTDINLLPPSQKQKRQALSMVTYVTIGFIMIIVMFCGFALTLVTVQITTNGKISEYENLTLDLNKQLAPYQSLEQTTKQVNNELSQIKKKTNQELHPNQVMDLISQKIGPDIVLTSLTIGQSGVGGKGSTDGKTINLVGVANSRAEIIDFKRAVENDPTFLNVNYEMSSASASDSNSNTFPFTLTATLSAAGIKTK